MSKISGGLLRLQTGKEFRFRFACVLLALFAAFALFLISARAESYDIDTGFRPAEDGFSFLNYGESGCRDPLCIQTFPIVNLSVAEMERLFGRSVCANRDAEEACRLSGLAESWMREANRAMNNGHCEGLSIMAARFFNRTLDPARFGNRSPNQLQLVGNERLQREIAFWYATQLLTETIVIEESPVDLLRSLILEMRENPNEVIQLGIYRRDLQSGHTVSAYAIKDMGDGIFRVMVYDSNHPALERFLTINAKTNSWQYLGSALPTDKAAIYSGEGSFNPIRRITLTEKAADFHCDFCPGARDESGSSVRIVTNGKISIFVADDEGKKTGTDWKNGEKFSELPEVQLRRILGTNSVTFPRDKRYHFWLNSPQDHNWQRFNMSLTGPGSILSLANVLESYEYPTLTYQPSDPGRNIAYESYDVFLTAAALPEISYIVANEPIEARITLNPELIGDPLTISNLNIFILHDPAQRTIGVEIYPAEDSAKFGQADFSLRFHGTIELFSPDRSLVFSTDRLPRPIEVKTDGSVRLNYFDWLETDTLTVEVAPDKLSEDWVIEVGADGLPNLTAEPDDV